MNGTITSIARQKKDSNRVSIFLDGEFAFGIHQDVLLEHGLHTGQVLSPEDVLLIQHADQYYVARTVALNYASQRPRTVHEVRQKLRQKSYEDAVIDAVTDRLTTLHYLDDATYARNYVRGRVNGRGYGPRRIQQELRRRGVDAAIIEAALAEELDVDHVLENARKQAAKRWTQLQREADPYKRRRKLQDYLMRRGFRHDTIRSVIEALESAS